MIHESRIGLLARQQVSARTVRRRLRKHGVSARRPCLRLPFTLQHRQKRLKWKSLVHGCRATGHHTPVTTVEELWHCVEAAWTSVPVHVIQSLFD
ncbi:hypothetical protein TNCV_1019181 [Trichonephila clavipes]|nr:hypothetical protein TNCV_1019181 [Trichonephila clavipes]